MDVKSSVDTVPVLPEGFEATGPTSAADVLKEIIDLRAEMRDDLAALTDAVPRDAVAGERYGDLSSIDS